MAAEREGNAAAFPTTAAVADASLPSVVVVLVMGLPAAGKTTFIRQLSSTPQLSVHHISIDQLYNQQAERASPHAASNAFVTFSPSLWHTAREAAYSRAVELLQTLTLTSAAQHPSVCHVVCVDDVFHLRSMRHSYYRLCRTHRTPIHQLLVDTPLATCLTNLTARSTTAATTSAAHSPLTAEYVVAVSERFDWPNEAEQRYTTAVDNSSRQLDTAAFLCNVFVPPPTAQSANEPSASHVQSVVHELDIALRRAIGQHMAAQRTARDVKEQDSKAAAASYARSVNDLRKRVLVDARQPGTAVYESMHAEDEGEMEEGEQGQVQAEVQRAVMYFHSLIETITPASTAQQTAEAARLEQ